MRSSADSHSIPPGSDVTLHCQFSGRPAPTRVEWYRDGARVDSSSSVSTSDSVSSLTIENFGRSEVYQCRVSNQHGSDKSSFFLCLEQQGREW